MFRKNDLIEKKGVKSKTIVAFLENRGWEIEKKSMRYYELMPPAGEEREMNPDFRFYIPHEMHEGSESYWLSVSGVIRSLADLFEMEVADLHYLFSKTLAEIKKDKALQAMLEGSGVSKFQVAETQV